MSFSGATLYRIFLLSAFGASLILGQEVTGAISGVVKDASGAQVPEVTVVAVNAGTGATYNGKSDSQGVYGLDSFASS